MQQRPRVIPRALYTIKPFWYGSTYRFLRQKGLAVTSVFSGKQDITVR